MSFWRRPESIPFPHLWIPAFAGMTGERGWIPVYTGMTIEGGKILRGVYPERSVRTQNDRD